MLLLLFAGCGPKDDTGDSAPAVTGPTLTHTAPGASLAGQDLDLVVTATDEDGVANVTLYYRTEGSDDWSNAPMAAAGGDDWSSTVPGDDVDAPALEYFFMAEDAADAAARSYLPVASTSSPFSLAISVQGEPLPFVEDFELDEDQTSITSLGWANASLGFRGYGWEAATNQAYDGAYAVYHSRGYSGTDPMDDWLLSPALDLSTVSSAQVSWREYATGEMLATHTLYVSTAGRDPSSGDFVEVGALPAPTQDAWARAQVVDLSAWVGMNPVYLAWRYEGVDADAWWLDDVRVEELQPWLDVSVGVDPSPVGPGESGSLVLTLTNSGLADAEGVSVTVDLPQGGATVATDTATLSGLAIGATDSVSYDLAVDAATVDNQYLPLTVTWSAGDTTVTLDESLLVGEQSLAHVVFTPAAEGTVTLVLGEGDPDAPSWSTTLHDGDATDVLDLSADITDAFAYLPPAASGRWFLTVDSSAGGSLDEATLTWDGVDYAATVLPAVEAGETATAWIPSPPELDVTVASLPASLEPGTLGAHLALTLANSGEATTGTLVATLTTADPDVTLTDGGPVDLGEIAAGETLAVRDLFTFDVAATHTDSSDLDFTLTLADDLDTWEVPIEVAVPWPVFRVVASGISGDGILDGGESADLTFTLSNRGGLSSDGDLDAVLSVESTSTASATVSANTEQFDEMGPGEQAENSDEWTITVDDGVDGDTVDLLLTLTDGSNTYEARTTLTLGDPPWSAISDDDPSGDAVGGWDFDLAGGSFRVVDGTLQVELQSYTAFDPDTLFIEAWGMSSASDWTFHRLLLQSGVSTLQGYDSGFTELSEPVVTYPDAYTVRFDMDIASMGLAIDMISFGFATGWCGPPEYYCDHWPDGWGYPYDSWDYGDWFRMAW